MQLELFQRNGVKKLENKIHIYELDCYKNATEEQKKRMRVRKDRYFDLEGLPSEEVRKLLEDFVWERGKKLAPSSLASEILYFNNIRNFLIEKNIKILRYEDENKIILQLKSWMMEKGYALTSKKKKMNVLEAVSRLSGTDLLSLCVPAGTVISENWISTAAFPSALYAGGESGKRGTAGDVWTAGLERALLDAYAAHFFTRFGQEKTGSVHYEQEYLLQGNASERENLKRTVNELLAVREAVNLAALYADSEKRSEAEALALAITGLAGITPITAAASFFIMTVWAFAESVADVKVLLAGGKIPFFKQPGEWQISLSALTEKGASIFLETGTDPSLKNGTDDRGLDYQDWLKLFFLIQGKSRFCYRMMDMIQNRISEKEPGFRMDQCQYGVSVSYAAQGTLIPLRRTSQKDY